MVGGQCDKRARLGRVLETLSLQFVALRMAHVFSLMLNLPHGEAMRDALLFTVCKSNASRSAAGQRPNSMGHV